MSKNNKINKNTIPEGFTVSMALVDMLPVLFFGGASIVLGLILHNSFVILCAGLMCLSGLLKVIWKLIAATSRRNIWPLFIQMRIAMPLAFLGLLIGAIISLTKYRFTKILAVIFSFPQLIFFILGILGLIGMTLCAIKLDSSDPKANWIEQIINSAAQGCILIGMILMYCF